MKPALPLFLIISLFTTGYLYAQYPPAAGEAGSTAVHCDSSVITEWASLVSIEPGYIDISDKDKGRVSIDDSGKALGKADNSVFSLGDGGKAVIGFKYPFRDTRGADFAVFENSFDGLFLELAKVEVSSDSINWVSFDASSLTPSDKQLDAFGTTDTRLINNLAGKYEVLYGTPFDLAELADCTRVDVMNVRWIRISDVVGSVDPGFATYDSHNRIINDPWPTPFETSGFDLDAVALLGLVSAVTDITTSRKINLYPAPVDDFVNIDIDYHGEDNIIVLSLTGRVAMSAKGVHYPFTLSTAGLEPGIFILRSKETGLVTKFIKK